jgi:hypothetical protein
MNRLFVLSLVTLWSLFTVPALTQTSQAAPVDYSIYAELLNKHVNDAMVSYAGFKKDEAKFDEFLKLLEGVDTSKLSRDEHMAFYINAYNAWTIKLILTEYPGIKSIRDIGNIFSSPWGKEIVRIEGKVLTLDNLEHDILRPKFKDARVHFAINCAALSCPPLISEPYTGARLQEQLQSNAVAFINNPKSNYLKGDELYVSRIFKWFSEDFDDGDILGYVTKFAQGDLKQKLLQGKDEIGLEYLDYDWSLNGK